MKKTHISLESQWERQRRQRHLVFFKLGAVVVTLGIALGVLLTEDAVQKEKEDDVKNEIAKFAMAQPNYRDSLIVFDAANAAEMVKLERSIKQAGQNKGHDSHADKQMLTQKIEERNRLVVKKEEVNQLIQTYAEKLQAKKRIQLTGNYLQCRGIIR